MILTYKNDLRSDRSLQFMKHRRQSHIIPFIMCIQKGEQRAQKKHLIVTKAIAIASESGQIHLLTSTQHQGYRPFFRARFIFSISGQFENMTKPYLV